jgi:hypothetical protein
MTNQKYRVYDPEEEIMAFTVDGKGLIKYVNSCGAKPVKTVRQAETLLNECYGIKVKKVKR